MRQTDNSVRRTNIRTAGGSWQGLVLEVGQPRRAGLQAQAAGRGHMLLRQAGEPVLLARTRRCCYSGVEYLRTGRYRSPLPPLRAAQARELAPAKTDTGLSRWAHHFAGLLAAAETGPLQNGQWLISRDSRPVWSYHFQTPERWALLPKDPEGSIEWWPAYGGGQALPLRRLSRDDDSRVKAYRKQVRDGTLPPVLLWWISALDSFVILDGHDRFLAAVVEEREPPLLILTSFSSQKAQKHVDAEISHYATMVPHILRQVEAGAPKAATALATANRKFGEDVQAAVWCGSRTQAWPLPGGLAAWRELAELHSPGWLARTEKAAGH